MSNVLPYALAGSEFAPQGSQELGIMSILPDRIPHLSIAPTLIIAGSELPGYNETELLLFPAEKTTTVPKPPLPLFNACEIASLIMVL
jgi:hypothetical protein